MYARWLSLLLAFWLMFSVFIWPHGPTEHMLVGVVWSWMFVVMSAASFVEPRIRLGVTFLGAVLAVYSLFAHHASGFTRWHDVIAGLCFVALGAVPSVALRRHEILVRDRRTV